MVIHEDSLDAIFGALADPTRRAIVARLANGEATVMEIAAPLSMSQPAVSRHLKVLEKAGLISRSRRAQQRPCRLEAEKLQQVNLWLERYRAIWEMQFRQLDVLLQEMQKNSVDAKKKRADIGARATRSGKKSSRSRNTGSVSKRSQERKNRNSVNESNPFAKRQASTAADKPISKRAGAKTRAQTNIGNEKKGIGRMPQ